MRPTITDDQFSALIEEHKGIIYKIANAYCRNADDRKDLIQEIIVHLWKSQDRYDERFKLSTWIYRVALNIAISAYRREKKRAERVSPLEEIIIEPATQAEQPDPRIATLHRIIDQLDELNRVCPRPVQNVSTVRNSCRLGRTLLVRHLYRRPHCLSHCSRAGADPCRVRSRRCDRKHTSIGRAGANQLCGSGRDDSKKARR